MSKSIPRIPASRFLYEDWNAGFCENFYHFESQYNRQKIKDRVIGWCPASHLDVRKRRDDEWVAIMLDDGTWCHLPTWAIKSEFEDFSDFWNFEGLDIQSDD